MTERRIVRRILMGAALLFGVAGCPPVDTSDGDAGTGGSATGGSATGGTAAVPVCQAVAALPTAGSLCSNAGESACTASGRCVCARGIWYCDTACASTYPTPPVAYTDCLKGTACMYSGGVGCTCFGGKWFCTSGIACPDAMTGARCDDPGTWCQYTDPAYGTMSCLCYPGPDGGAATYTCVVGTPCPKTPPPYPTACSSNYGYCPYASGRTLCSCPFNGGQWICDWPNMFAPPVDSPEGPPASN
jgi:hypothetical protein